MTNATSDSPPDCETASLLDTADPGPSCSNNNIDTKDTPLPDNLNSAEQQPRNQNNQKRTSDSSSSFGKAVYDPRYCGYRVYVGNLSSKCRRFHLREIFVQYGNLVNIWVSPLLQFGYVTFHHASDAEKAVDALNGYKLFGLSMQVEHPPSMKSSDKRNDCHLPIELYGSVNV